MELLIVIPALNEQESIASTINRCIGAKEHIMNGTAVTKISITVVSDGSTDDTEKIANRYKKDIKVIAYEENRGYGAALKAGFASSDSELVGFIDADGTCDPMFFADLCKLIDDGADIALGSRLHKGSAMPAHRKFGNRLFASMMSIFSSSKAVAASGCRML